ncbi:MAG: hypothetical protein ABI301_02055, partial [Jatrophihabitantaceae bacterium]
QTVAEAISRADRIRAESDRELVAASQRRDSINAQLTNVRQMLATLSGTTPAAADVDAEPAAHPGDQPNGKAADKPADTATKVANSGPAEGADKSESASTD